MATSTILADRERRDGSGVWGFLVVASLLVLALLVWQGMTSAGNPDPAADHISKTSSILDIAVLVFREGLECILVLAAVTASMTGAQQVQRKPVAAGAGFGFLATLLTWAVAVRILDNLGTSVSALNLQAATGLLAVVVLLVVMNWFFHKMYWTGWISLHNKKKRELTTGSAKVRSRRNILLGLGMLGFSSMYREGVEVVLFLQSYRLKLGSEVVLYGVLIGLFFTAIVAGLTFVAHRKLPYRRMLVLTGMMLAAVLFVMVGEQAQEMQLAHWLSKTEIVWLKPLVAPWMGLWFSIFPTVESLVAQAVALVLVLGSYFLANRPATPKRGSTA